MDARTDIFAVGAMLYEMLSGSQPFRGRSPMDTLTGILSSDPAPLGEVAATVPAGLARIVHRCLEKLPDARFQSAADLAFALESVTAGSAAAVEAGSVPLESRASPAVAPEAVAGGGSAAASRLGGPAVRRLLVGVGLSLLAGLVAAVMLRPAAPPAALLRLSLPPPPGTTWGAVPAVSPDGRRVAFVGVRDAQTQLFLQLLDSRDASPVAGTAGALSPFWSPDGMRVGFLAAPAGVGASLEMRTVGLDGILGPPLWTGLCRGAAFAPDGAVLVGSGRLGLLRVPPGGGPALPVTTLARDHLKYRPAVAGHPPRRPSRALLFVGFARGAPRRLRPAPGRGRRVRVAEAAPAGRLQRAVRPG